MIHLIIGHFSLAFFCFNDFTRDSLSPTDVFIFILGVHFIRHLSCERDFNVSRNDPNKTFNLSQSFRNHGYRTLLELFHFSASYL